MGLKTLGWGWKEEGVRKKQLSSLYYMVQGKLGREQSSCDWVPPAG
jgi:hypothetical protein